MRNLRFKIPPPNHLVTFEASARNLSFTIAAKELNVSRVAVSQQIKSLEKYLGVQLFQRLHRALRLTHHGLAYYEGISASLNNILNITNRIRQMETVSKVIITTTSGFSTYWLMPKIGEFRKKHPEIDLQFVISDTYVNLKAEEVDIAIRYGESDKENYNSTLLAQEFISPVCSPDYIFQRASPVKASDLLQEKLIQLNASYNTHTRWEAWFKTQGVNTEVISKSITINTYVAYVQAALEGQGISLLGPPIMDKYLNSGALIKVFDVPPFKREAFFLLTQKDKPLTPSAKLLYEWLCKEFSVSPHHEL